MPGRSSFRVRNNSVMPNNNTITTSIECEPFLPLAWLRGTDFAFVSKDVRLNKSIAAFARVSSAHRKETCVIL